MPKKKSKATRIGEALEKIDTLGQEDEHKAAKWVKEEAAASEKIEKEKEAVLLEKFDKADTTIKSYSYMVAKTLHDFVLEINMPPTYQWGVVPTNKGIVLIIQDKNKKQHIRKFKLLHDPKFDLNACYHFAMWAEDVYDQCEGVLEAKNQGGVWVPN